MVCQRSKPPTLAMSASTTTETLPNSVHHLLQAYNVRHSGYETDQGAQASAPSQLPAGLSFDSEPRQTYPSRAQPWHDELNSRRRVPPYRATNRTHSLALRPAGRTASEAVIVSMIFFGVNIIEVSGRSSALRRYNCPWAMSNHN